MSAMLLVSGTCIGGGMLALPVATGVSGFFPSLVVMVFCWIAMTLSALMLLEANLWMDEGAHVISMSGKLLGRWGKVVAWTLYLFICYASIIAYTAGGGALFKSAIDYLLNIDLSKGVSCTLFLVIFGAAFFFGNAFVGRVNAVLVIAMMAAYVLLVGTGFEHVKADLLQFRRWQGAWLAIPFFLTAFSFQTMVPSLTPLLKRHPGAIRLAIIGGTTMTFLVYVVWQWFVLGVIPVEGSHGLALALERGEPATLFLRHHVGNGHVALIAEYFAFFALVTSYLGIALGLFDFLADGLHISRVGNGKLWISLLIAVPTLFFAIYYERAFILALDSSGGYGDSILNGIMPAMMVWMGRYRLGLAGPYRLRGGKPLLIGVALFFFGALLLEILLHSGLVENKL